jgi:hypothetical protein
MVLFDSTDFDDVSTSPNVNLAFIYRDLHGTRPIRGKNMWLSTHEHVRKANEEHGSTPASKHDPVITRKCG